MPERSSNGGSKQPHASREQLQRRIDELSAQLVETERALSAAKRERDEHKITAAGASVSELEAQKSRAELVKDKEVSATPSRWANIQVYNYIRYRLVSSYVM